jgi:hypothetical protein
VVKVIKVTSDPWHSAFDSNFNEEESYFCRTHEPDYNLIIQAGYLDLAYYQTDFFKRITNIKDER